MKGMDNFEWLGQQMRAKTAQWQQVGSSTGERIEFADKCGAFAKMDNQLEKDLAWMLAAGDYDGPEWQRCEAYLYNVLHGAVTGNRNYKQGEVQFICKRIAEMELYFFMNDEMQRDYTTQGRLRRFGLLGVMSVKTYQNTWAAYAGALVSLLYDAKFNADAVIGDYRKELRKALA